MTALRIGLGIACCIALPAVAAGAVVYALCDWVTRSNDRAFDARVAETIDEAESWVHALWGEEVSP